jgi:thiol-disulfide isomerase/thioredoxin
MGFLSIERASVLRRGVLGGGLVLLLAVPSPTLAGQTGRVGELAQAITVTDLEGNEVTLDARARGRPMLLEFWATWCEVCAALMPEVRRAATAYGGEVDFIGVNVTINESRSRVARWVERERPPYRTMYDERGVAVRTFRAPTTSYVVIVDATGVIRYTGVGDDQDLSGALAKVVSR